MSRPCAWTKINDLEPTHTCSVTSCDVVYVLFLEKPDKATLRTMPLLEQGIETLIETFSEAPVMIHCELLLPPIPDDGGKKTRFATYLDLQDYHAGWQNRLFEDDVTYYLTQGSWRAVPVFLPNAVERVRESADASEGASYSIARYATSARPLRRLSWLLPSSPKAPGHCATLVARVLQNAGAGAILPKSAAWYSPSTLYHQLARHAATRLGDDPLFEMKVSLSHEAVDTQKRLLRSALSDIPALMRELGEERLVSSVRASTLRASNAAHARDEVASRASERDLARMLNMWLVFRSMVFQAH